MEVGINWVVCNKRSALHHFYKHPAQCPLVIAPYAGYRIYVEDGRKGVFDMKPYLDFGVFRELRDVHYFNQVGIVFGAVTWPHEQDIAPETLLAGLHPSESETLELKAAETVAEYRSDKPA